jgi:hypothetical protein
MEASTGEEAAMNKLLRITKAALPFVALGLGVSALSGTASAHEVPNENWHIHDGQGLGPAFGDHHAPLAFFPDIFEPLDLEYGSAEAPYVSCPNATDKVFLPHGVHGAVGAAGVCMSDEWVVHLRFGTEAPAGWSSLDVGGGFEVHYLLTPRG